MITWAPLAKSPNWASQMASPSGQPSAVAVFEAQGGRLAQRAVTDLDRSLAVGQVPQRRGRVAGLLIVEDRVAVAEGAAAGVLAGQAHRVALAQERAEGQRLAHGPVDRGGSPRPTRPGSRGGAGPRGGPWKPSGDRGQVPGDLLDQGRVHRGRVVGGGRVGRRAQALPQPAELLGPRSMSAGSSERRLQLGCAPGRGVGEMVVGEDALGGSPVDEELQRRVPGAWPVHQGLGERRLVGLVVSVLR